MAKGKPISELKAWRTAAGLTMDAAAALIVVDGKAATRGTWHAWESGRKVPKYEQMIELCRATGLNPGVFYGPPKIHGRELTFVAHDEFEAIGQQRLFG